MASDLSAPLPWENDLLPVERMLSEVTKIRRESTEIRELAKNLVRAVEVAHGAHGCKTVESARDAYGGLGSRGGCNACADVQSKVADVARRLGIGVVIGKLIVEPKVDDAKAGA